MSRANDIQNIIDHELYFHFSKSWGPGGQNINKRKTKAELYFNINSSQYLTSEQKGRLVNLAGQMVHHQEGVLIMTCQEERYQHANKEKVIGYFAQLLKKAYVAPKERIRTTIPKSQRKVRSIDKKFASKTKRLRQKPKEE